MKLIKKCFIGILVGAILIASTAMFAACDFDFNKFIEENEWPYSENGEAEIELNFSALLADDFTGIYEWNGEVVAEETTAFNLKYYADKSGTTKMQKYVYTTDDKELAVLNIYEGDEDGTTYYINETNNTYSTAYTSEFEELMFAVMGAGRYGIIQLNDEEDQPQWTFTEKREDITVKNSSGADEATVEYEYASVEEENSNERTVMLVNFRKVLTPVIARLEYKIYSDVSTTEVLDSTVTIYIILHSDAPVEADFTVPSETSGYTLQSNNE
ncbi:MAG: hypothetical protein PHE93_06400 [Clostridia bacterium]|nr:hypothetical protein [Clostridia bacterium]